MLVGSLRHAAARRRSATRDRDSTAPCTAPAPDIAGRGMAGIAYGAVLSAAMLLRRSLDREGEADAVGGRCRARSRAAC